MMKYETQDRERLAKRDRRKKPIIIRFVGLNESSGRNTDNILCRKYSATLKDVINVINIANCTEEHDCSKEHNDFEFFKSRPKKFNENWKTLPDDINFYSIYERYKKYKLLDSNKPIARKSNNITLHNACKKYDGYFCIYFSIIPLVQNLFGENN